MIDTPYPTESLSVHCDTSYHLEKHYSRFSRDFMNPIITHANGDVVDDYYDLITNDSSSCEIYVISYQMPEYKAIFVNNPWLNDIYDNSVLSSDNERLLRVYMELNSLVARNEVSCCNSILKFLSFRMVNDLFLIAPFRLMSRLRDDIDVWDISLAKSKAEAQLRGMDISKLYSGL